MSATVSDPMFATPAHDPKLIAQIEIVFAKCDCCGLKEECTPAYIERVRERFNGAWICGLCSEAVKEEIIRSGTLMSTEEAMQAHMNVCKKFKAAGPPANSTIHLISAVRHILRKSLTLDSPRALRSVRNSERLNRNASGPSLTRSDSCMPKLSG